MKTNKDLVSHARMALSEGWGYVWGTFGYVLNETLYQQKFKQYPKEVGRYANFIRAHWMGKRVTDCVGLIKSCLWWDGSKPRYNADTDVSADTMYNMASKKGPIASIPELPGICVWKQGHIGVYIGDGKVIEAAGTMKGVILTPLKGPGATAWTNWLACPFLEYDFSNLTTLTVAIAEGDVKGLHVRALLDSDGNSYLPTRAVAQAYGAHASWDPETRTVKLT